MIYETLADLRYACEQARLNGKDVPVLMLDNDDTAAHDSDGSRLFEMHPATALEQALTLLEIPWEVV